MKEEEVTIAIRTISNTVTHNGGVECLDNNDAVDSVEDNDDDSIEYNTHDGIATHSQHVRTELDGTTQRRGLDISRKNMKPIFDMGSHFSESNHLTHHHGPSLFDCDHGCFDNKT